MINNSDDILRAVCELRPGTSWNLRGDVLEQADDGEARVSAPTDIEIQTYVLQNPDPINLARQTLKDTKSSSDEKINALIQILGL